MPLLRGKSVFNLFFENSTRTRTTFEIAAKRLSADVHQPRHRALLRDQGRIAARHHRQPAAMAADMFVVRHSESARART